MKISRPGLLPSAPTLMQSRLFQTLFELSKKRVKMIEWWIQEDVRKRSRNGRRGRAGSEGEGEEKVKEMKKKERVEKERVRWKVVGG